MVSETLVIPDTGKGHVALRSSRSEENVSHNSFSANCLDDMAESEVFVGDEEEFTSACNVQFDSKANFVPFELNHDPFEFNDAPLLLSPSDDSSNPSTCMVISYHEDLSRSPLDSVREEVEQEAVEEASMHLEEAPSSLASQLSLLSTCSSPEVTSGFGIGIHTSPLAIPSVVESHRLNSSTPQMVPKSSIQAGQASGLRSRLDNTTDANKKGSSMPSTAKGATKSSRHILETKKLREDKGAIMGCRMGQTTVSARPAAVVDKKSQQEILKRSVNSNVKRRDGDKPVTAMARIGREVDDLNAEKFDTLGRRKKLQGDSETRDTLNGLGKESKSTLDTYATLPRRKAREMSARWREQYAAEEEAKLCNSESKSTLLKRSKSMGKSDGKSGPANATAANPSWNGGIGGTRSRMVVASHGTTTPSRITARKPTMLATSIAVNPRREKTIICLETSVQTLLTGEDLMRLSMSQCNSHISGGTEVVHQHRIKIEREQLTETRIEQSANLTKDVEVQAELMWRLGDGDLPSHVRQLIVEKEKWQLECQQALLRVKELEDEKVEAERLQEALKEERTVKEDIQAELDRTTRAVKDMLSSMDVVDKEFTNRGDSLIELENQLHHSAEFNIQMQDRLNQYEEYTLKIKRDLDKSIAAQKMLLQQAQDLEAEGQETVEFMAEEKNALNECLRETESELKRRREELQQLSMKYKQKDEEARHMVRLAEERRLENVDLHTAISVAQTKCRELSLNHKGEIFTASHMISNMTSRLQTLLSRLMREFSVGDADLESIVSLEGELSFTNNGTRVPYKVSSRSPSPRKTILFISALSSAMREGQVVTQKLQAPEGRNSPEGSECLDLGLEDGSDGSGVPLKEQIVAVDTAVSRFLKLCCVLKADSDSLVSVFEEDIERQSSQIQSQQQTIEQQLLENEQLMRSESRAKHKLALVKRQLEAASQSLAKFQEQDYEIKAKKFEEELQQVNCSLRRVESLHQEKEKQLKEALNRLCEIQGEAPSGHVSEAQHLQELADLSDKITSLRQTVMERDHLISEFSERRMNDLAEAREAQIEIQKLNRRLQVTVEQVLRALELVPELVNKTPVLNELLANLSVGEKSTSRCDSLVAPNNGALSTHKGIATNYLVRESSFKSLPVGRSLVVKNTSSETHL